MPPGFVLFMDSHGGFKELTQTPAAVFVATVHLLVKCLRIHEIKIVGSMQELLRYLTEAQP